MTRPQAQRPKETTTSEPTLYRALDDLLKPLDDLRREQFHTEGEVHWPRSIPPASRQPKRGCAAKPARPDSRHGRDFASPMQEAGMGRPNHVQIATSGGRTIAIPWHSRYLLLDQIRNVASARGIRRAFLAAGATRQVKFSVEEEAILAEVIEQWADRLRGGHDALPDGIPALRNAMLNDPDGADGDA